MREDMAPKAVKILIHTAFIMKCKVILRESDLDSPTALKDGNQKRRYGEVRRCLYKHVFPILASRCARMKNSFQGQREQ